MSVDSANKRASAVNPGSPWRGQLPFPDGDVGKIDRIQLLFMYAAFIVNVTSTAVLQKPVDYALAGDQDTPVRRGRASGRGLRHTFGE